jgi:tetratricopeptide (TPR) repeat protein
LATEEQTLGNLATVHYNAGEYLQAVEFYQKSLAVALEIGDPQSAGNSHYGLCLTFFSLGDLDRGLANAEQSAKAFEGKEQARSELNSLANQE